MFEAGVACSAKTMYPDWLSLTGKGYVASMYKKYGKIISPMGCRAFLSPWYEQGGMHPAFDGDEPVFVGRFNIGVVSLHLPMIHSKSKKRAETPTKYWITIWADPWLHIQTYAYLGEMRASTNPLHIVRWIFAVWTSEAYGQNKARPEDSNSQLRDHCSE